MESLTRPVFYLVSLLLLVLYIHSTHAGNIGKRLLLSKKNKNTTMSKNTTMPTSSSRVSSRLYNINITVIKTTKATPTKASIPHIRLKPAKVFIPIPKDFVAEWLKNQTVYLRWDKISLVNASYQVHMAYGNRRSHSKFKKLVSTFNNEQMLKLHHLLQYVDGNISLYTFLKFKVRVSIGGKHFSDFTNTEVINLHISSARAISPSVTRIPDPDEDVWKYVLPVICVVLGAVLTAVGIYAYKQVLYKRRYRQYMRTHYETDSEAVSVSNENYDELENDQPHLAFSDDTRDDEHLVIA